MFRKNIITAALVARSYQPGFDDPPKIPDELKDVVNGMIRAATEEATTGLKSKNNELLGEVRGLKDRLKPFEGLDPVALKAMMDKIGNDEEAQLLAKGQLDEVVKRRTERMQQDFDKKLKQAQDEIAKRDSTNQKLAKRATNEAIIKAATEAGVERRALEDITLRAQSAGWTIDDEGNVVAKKGDEVLLGKDAKTPLSPSEWVESLRETADHLWPRAQGSGANGSKIPVKDGKIDPNLPPEDRVTAARQQQVAQQRR